MSRLTRIVFTAPLFMLFATVFLFGCNEEPAHPPVVDLSQNHWLIKRDILPGDAAGFSAGPTTLQQHLPVDLLTLLPPTAERPVQYTLQYQFTLKSTQSGSRYFLYIPRINNGWSIHLNGRLIQEDMPLDEQGYLRYSRYRDKLTLPLPENTLRSGENTLVIFLAGKRPSIFTSDFVSLADPRLTIDYSSRPPWGLPQLASIGISAILLFLGIFYTTLYLRLREEKHYLFFGLVCLAVVYLDLVSIPLLQKFFHYRSIPEVLYNAAGPLTVAALVAFLDSYFRGEGRLKKIQIWILRFQALIFFIFFTRFWIDANPGFTIFIYTLPLIIGYCFVFLFTQYRRRKEDALVMLLGMSVFLMSALIELFIEYGQADNNYEFRGLKYYFFLLVSIFSLVLINRFTANLRESRRLNVELQEQNKAFARFVPDQFLDHLGKESAMEIQRGDSVDRTMAVLFADIRGFTTLSEGMTPEDNFRFINEYLGEVEPAIEMFGGFVDKFIGDAVMALFAEEDGQANAAERAARAAVELHRRIRMQNIERAERGLFPIESGTGLHTGPLMLGTVGGRRRLDTTVIGDTVNLASRLEGLTRRYDARVLISDSTAELLSAETRAETRPVDFVKVKGKQKAVELFEIYSGDDDDLRAGKTATRTIFSAGVAAYRLADFTTARQRFAEASEIFAQDRLLDVYIQRCDDLLTRGTPADWTPVVTADAK